MRTRHAAALCILLAGFALAVAKTQLDGGNNKGSATTWLADVLTPGAKAMYAEEETACLRFLKGTLCQCDPTDPVTCNHQLQMNDFGCCHDDHAGERSFLESPPTVASCTWDAHYYDTYPVVAPNIDLAGNATFTCELNRNADECGSPLCDGMKIRGAGKMYYVYDTTAAPLFTRGPAAPYTGVIEPRCGRAIPRLADSAKKSNGADNHPKASAEADAAGYYRGEPDFTAYYPTNFIAVFHGTFSLVSPRHRDRLTGMVQFNAPNDGNINGATPVYTLPAGGLAFNPWALELKFDGRDHY